MVYAYIVAVLAVGFGLTSPWFISDIPDFKWWRIWFLAGSAGFAIGFWFSIRAMNSSPYRNPSFSLDAIDRMIGAVPLFWIQSFSMVVFAVSFAARAYVLSKD